MFDNNNNNIIILLTIGYNINNNFNIALLLYFHREKKIAIKPNINLKLHSQIGNS